MLFKSQLIAQGSGSMGGLVASHNRFGQYMRRRAIPVNPSTSFQQAVRLAFMTLAAAWKNILTAQMRTDWETYAINTPVTNRIGDTVTLTGLNMYIRCNTPRIQIGLSRVDAGPSIFGLPETDSTFTPTAVASTDIVSLAFSNALPWANEVGGYLIAYQTRPFSPSIVYLPISMREVKNVAGAVIPPTSPATYTSPFNLSAGQALKVQARISRADGRLSAPFWVRAIAS